MEEPALRSRFEWVTEPRFFKVEKQADDGSWHAAAKTIMADSREEAAGTCDDMGKLAGAVFRPGAEV